MVYYIEVVINKKKHRLNKVGEPDPQMMGYSPKMNLFHYVRHNFKDILHDPKNEIKNIKYIYKTKKEGKKYYMILSMIQTIRTSCLILKCHLI